MAYTSFCFSSVFRVSYAASSSLPSFFLHFSFTALFLMFFDYFCRISFPPFPYRVTRKSEGETQKMCMPSMRNTDMRRKHKMDTIKQLKLKNENERFHRWSHHRAQPIDRQARRTGSPATTAWGTVRQPAQFLTDNSLTIPSDLVASCFLQLP